MGEEFRVRGGFGMELGGVNGILGYARGRSDTKLGFVLWGKATHGEWDKFDALI